MVLFTRAVARDFATLFGRCVSGRPRGPGPPVVVSVRGGVRTVHATTPDGVTLAHTAPAAGEPDDAAVLPASVPAEVGGGTDDDVTLERQSRARCVVRWPGGGGKPRTLPAGLILPGKQHGPPEVPPLTPVGPAFAAALDACGRAAARADGRFALSKVQVRGRSGRVVGTDGKAAVLWGGFALPFADDILVPALPVFGAKPVARGPDVRVGRAPTHLVVAAGPWAVWLPADTTSRYPDVASAVPADPPTAVAVDDRDAADLARALPGLPGAGDEPRPVTLDAGGTLTVRGRGEAGDVGEVVLPRSPVTGPPARVAVDRRVLARGLSLGCRTLRLTPDRPVVLEGGGVTVVAAALDPAPVAPAAGRAPTPPAADAPTATDDAERRPTMTPPETNGPAPPRGDPPDPLAAAEELRAALADAAAKAGRLVAALKQTGKQKRALATVLSGLKQLKLAPPPG